MKAFSKLKETGNDSIIHQQFQCSLIFNECFYCFLFVSGSKTGTEVSSFEFLKKELPVRLANIMQEINDVPETFQQMPSVAMVRNW